jgi:drug/metabolite transporter (DMT)-like permease
LGALSIVTFLGTLLTLPIVVTWIPADYFVRDQRQGRHREGTSTVPHLLRLVGKNLLGIVFVLIGVALLVLPGQGILTILLGLMLMNFPGKRALERRLVQQPSVLGAINWLRAKAHQPALVVPSSQEQPTEPGHGA